MKQLVTRHGQLATIMFVGSFTASLGYVVGLEAQFGFHLVSFPLFPPPLPPAHVSPARLISKHRYTLTTGRSALMDAKAWLGATTMTDEGVLGESDHRKYQMRLSR